MSSPACPTECLKKAATAVGQSADADVSASTAAPATCITSCTEAVRTVAAIG